MAKSLRSKRRRKVRAEKRIVNAKKELVKLKEVVAKLSSSSELRDGKITKESLQTLPGTQVVEEPMIVDEQNVKISKKEQLKINNKWMNQRKIKSIKRKIKKHNQKKTRKGKSAKISSKLKR